MADLVSIIIPVYNTSEYLSKCLDSIVNQNYKDLEIIVVNDGSTDNSEEIINTYLKNDSRIKLINKPNGGLSSARNAGLDQAEGCHLTFVDSDDWVEPNFISSLIECSKKSEADIVFCNLQKVNQDNVVFKKLYQAKETKNAYEVIDGFQYFGEISWFACNKLFKAELFKDIRFFEGIHFEDIATIPMVFLKTSKIAFCSHFLYNYFERQGSITQSFTDKGLDMFKALNGVEERYKTSAYRNNEKQWKRFYILQGFYSYIAYVARVKDRELKKRMFQTIKIYLKKQDISKKEILTYERFDKNYLFNLSLLKQIYYLFVILFKI